MDNIQRLHAQIYGRVQGVSFRFYTERRAIDLRLTGWIRNKVDGSVEVVAEGQQIDLEKLLKFLHQGPSGARVERVEHQWQQATGEFRDFLITG